MSNVGDRVVIRPTVKGSYYRKFDGWTGRVVGGTHTANGFVTVLLDATVRRIRVPVKYLVRDLG